MVDTPGSTAGSTPCKYRGLQIAGTADHRLHVDERCGANRAGRGKCAFRDRSPVAHEFGRTLDRRVRGKRDQPAPEFAFKPVHHRNDGDQGGHAQADAQHGHPGNERYEEPPATGPDVAQPDEDWQGLEHARPLRKAARLPAATPFCTLQTGSRSRPGPLDECYIEPAFTVGIDDMRKTVHSAIAVACVGMALATAQAQNLQMTGTQAASRAGVPSRGTTMAQVEQRYGAPADAARRGGPAPDHALGLPVVRRLFRRQHRDSRGRVFRRATGRLSARPPSPRLRSVC